MAKGTKKCSKDFLYTTQRLFSSNNSVRFDSVRAVEAKLDSRGNAWISVFWRITLLFGCTALGFGKMDQKNKGEPVCTLPKDSSVRTTLTNLSQVQPWRLNFWIKQMFEFHGFRRITHCVGSCLKHPILHEKNWKVKLSHSKQYKTKKYTLNICHALFWSIRVVF